MSEQELTEHARAAYRCLPAEVRALVEARAARARVADRERKAGTAALSHVAAELA